jgi:hypothetical protein
MTTYYIFPHDFYVFQITSGFPSKVNYVNYLGYLQRPEEDIPGPIGCSPPSSSSSTMQNQMSLISTAETYPWSSSPTYQSSLFSFRSSEIESVTSSTSSMSNMSLSNKSVGSGETKSQEAPCIMYAVGKNFRCHTLIQLLVQPKPTLLAVCMPPTDLVASAMHDSGFIYPMEVKRKESLVGYSLTFIPRVPGRYSISVYYKRSAPPLIIAAPLEMVISKNYECDSVMPHLGATGLGAATSKFWGITSNKFTDTVRYSI